MGSLSAEHLMLLLLVLALVLLAYGIFTGAIQRFSDAALGAISSPSAEAGAAANPSSSPPGFFSEAGHWTGGLLGGFSSGVADKFSDAAHRFDPNFCVSDRNCDAGRACSRTLGCVYPSRCTLLAGPARSEGRIDLLFIGDGFHDDNELNSTVRNVLEGGKWGGGLLDLEPFASHQDLFDVRLIRSNESIPLVHRADGTDDLDPGAVDALSAQCPAADYQFVLSNQYFRSYSAGRVAYISLAYDPRPDWGRLVSHEFGHLFGGLKDEYAEPRLGDLPGYPNCASSPAQAREWWGDVGGVGQFLGCSYLDRNIRPTNNSIMRDHRLSNTDYGPVNEKYLGQLLGQWPQGTEKTKP